MLILIGLLNYDMIFISVVRENESERERESGLSTFKDILLDYDLRVGRKYVNTG